MVSLTRYTAEVWTLVALILSQLNTPFCNEGNMIPMLCRLRGVVRLLASITRVRQETQLLKGQA